MTLLTYDQLRSKGIPLSRTQIWRLVRDGRFPKPIRVSSRRVAWLSAELDGYIEERIRLSRGAAA